MAQDKDAVDFYTLVHMMYGYGAKRLGMSNTQIVALAILYELVEPSIIRYMREDLNLNVWGYESKKNIAVDIAIAYIGAKIAEERIK